MEGVPNILLFEVSQTRLCEKDSGGIPKQSPKQSVKNCLNLHK